MGGLLRGNDASGSGELNPQAQDSGIVADHRGMDATVAAVALVQNQAAVQRLEFSVKMIKQNELAKQGLMDLIVASAQDARLYTASGGVAGASAGKNLNQSA